MCRYRDFLVISNAFNSQVIALINERDSILFFISDSFSFNHLFILPIDEFL
jgi:hypothetical protein